MPGKDKSALICGSVAYGTIMVFPDRFKAHILPDKLHMLNVAFLVPQMRREFGGCAGNIAYNLKLLGDVGYAMGGVGSDFAPYSEWMQKVGLSEKYLVTIPEEHCAQGFITTDLDANQITAFHPGAMNHSWKIKVPSNDGISIGVVAPDSRQGMLEHAEQFKAAGIPFIFDPGQQLPQFDGTELRRFIEMASWVAVNDYEGRMLCERTGLTLEQMSRSHLKGIVVTLAAEGCEVWIDGQRSLVPGVKATQVVDPTGCGDAFRAALLYGLERGWSLERCAALGNRVGALKIACAGPQNHTLDRALLEQ
jgi:adenosine kinase